MRTGLSALSAVATGFWLAFLAPLAQAADVLVVGDTQLKPVVEAISGIESTLEATARVYTPAEVRDQLAAITEKEEAKVVVAIGREALGEALRLPPSIAVIYGLVVIPPTVLRPNTTGFYMATPVEAYVEIIANYIPSIRKLAVVGSRHQLDILATRTLPLVTPYSVTNSVNFVDTVDRLDSMDAILLLPDGSLMTKTAMEEVYLRSFRRNIPLLGVSERQVKEGALLALVFAPAHVGKQIGETATLAVRGMDVGRLPASPPRKFDIYLNLNTAHKMGVRVADELTRMAVRVY